jgi:hopanoid biosynthesis associated radical SAM protein HpnH
MEPHLARSSAGTARSALGIRSFELAIPLIQAYRVGRYIAAKKLRGVKRYPLVLMLEPLFQCNLACSGCGKIDHTKEVLQKRMSVEDALHAVDECGAPMVSIPGGEPLIHKDLPEIVSGIVARRKFVYLCTNAILLPKHIHEYQPSPYLTFSIHLDGSRERHDESVCQEGVFDKAVAAIRLARSKGFRVTINCTLFSGENPDHVADFFDEAMALGIEGIMVSPGYSYNHAPRQDVFLGRSASKRLFREIFKRGRARRSGAAKPAGRWSFNHSGLFLDFLAGNQAYQCTPWSTPTYNLFGWQRPCYLLTDEGSAPSFRSLMEETDWERYGVGRNPACDNCMAHCGYEGTAVDDAFAHPIKALKAAWLGPRVTGAMAPELPILYGDRGRFSEATVPVESVRRANRESDGGHPASPPSQ